jgi:pectin methylesterase-like acyl-CoA thioesterase
MPYKIRKTVAAVGLFLILSFVLVAILAVQFEVLVPPIAIPDTQFEVVIRTIVVPDDYSTIQEAIDAASEGDVIFVKKGMYNETLKIEKALTLRG